jgi:low temperature requirement protein LtrA
MSLTTFFITLLTIAIISFFSGYFYGFFEAYRRMLKIIDLIYLSYYKEGENNEKR